ncbi:MAG: 4-hydroxybenzoate octaprenyltransferase, partial [Dehalococcoidia bacterium]|nr:4-hydroxybenzoate octaprenyltransferase [Dehalococcoidia bacterium]
ATLAVLYARAATRAPDGMRLKHFVPFYERAVDDLPAEADMEAAVRDMASELTALAAAAFGIFLFAAYQLNMLAFVLAPVAAAYLVFYPFTKRFTWTANLLLGWALAISPTAAWIGVTGSLSPEPVLISLAVALWAGSFDILYHTQDYEFQRENGLHSVAARFGVLNAFRIARTLDVLAVVCLITLWVWMGLGWPFLAACGIASCILWYKYRLVSPDDLSKMGMAFGRINAFVSTTMLVGTIVAISI